LPYLRKKKEARLSVRVKQCASGLAPTMADVALPPVLLSLI
jgi:hypothetical protein